MSIIRSMFGIHKQTVIGAVILALASSGLTAWFVSSSGKSDSPGSLAGYTQPVPEPPAMEKSGDPVLDDKLARIDGRINSIDKRLSDNNTDASSMPVQATPDESRSPAPRADAVQEMQQQLAQTENRFQMEERDAAWSSDMTTKIQNVFTADSVVGNSSLSSIDCRSSTCKLEVSLQDSNGLTNVRNKLLEEMGTTLPYGAIQPGGSGSEVTIYLGSKSETFRP